jgi:Putative quorum-sensing-regulated virulence factor
MKTLQDTDPMPFGKHKGKPMQDVPASYLHWLWSNGAKEDHDNSVPDYIRRNLDALKQEYKDGVW